MTRPRAAVIGYGYAGRAFHSYLIGLEERLELAGIASRSPETRRRIATERGCHAYESLDDVLADDSVDLVVLGTPHHVHAEQAIAALDAGKHVVTDKPMCTTLAECDAMIAAAERNDRMLQVFQNRRWDGDYLTLRKLLDEGALGDLRWLEMAWQVPRAPGGWRGQKAAGGGRFFDLGAHMLDQTLMLFPQAVTSVFCRIHYDYDTSDVDSHAMVVLGFADGRTAVVDAGGMHAIAKPRFHAFGSAGAFRKYGVDPQEKAMKEERIDQAVEPEENYGLYADGQSERRIPTIPGCWREFYRNVAAVLIDQAPPAIKLHETRRVMAVYDAAHRAAEDNTVVQTDIPGLN
jgi:scyllo-inositol 2-dehydrogenase (NADP+)